MRWPQGRSSGCSAAWQRASFGTRRSQVQILPSRPSARLAADWVVALVLLAVGQLALIALGPLSRVGDPGAGTAGIGDLALLAPDSIRYLSTSGSWPEVAAQPWTRWGYLALLRIGHLLGDAATSVVVAQGFAMAGAGVLLLRTGRATAGPVAGLVSASMLLLNPMTAQWARFVLTESIFYALAVSVATIAVHRDHRTRVLIMLAFAVAAVAFRPTGPLLAAAAVTLALVGARRSRRRKALLVTITWVAAALLLALGSIATGPPSEGSFEDQLRAGVVVEGTPDVRVTLDMPEDPSTGVLLYTIAHPAATARLGLTRIAVEVAQVRRHYPPIVNAILAAAMVMIAGLASAGLRDRRGRPLRLPTAVVLLPLVGIVGATFAVPEGRYGWAGLVALSPAVGIGAARVVERLRSHRGGDTAR